MEPTVEGVEFPTIGLSQAWNDLEHGMLQLRTYVASVSERGRQTHFKVTRIPDIDSLFVRCDGEEFRGWSRVDDQSIDIHTNVEAHTFQIFTGYRTELQNQPRDVVRRGGGQCTGFVDVLAAVAHAAQRKRDRARNRVSLLRRTGSVTRLVALPVHPADVDWPTESWSHASLVSRDAAAFARHADSIFDLTAAQGVTYALLIAQRGQLIYERYAAGANNFYLQYSWSMAKSITQALVGILVRQGRIDVHAAAAVPEWQAADDPRRHITLDQLLKMRSGLQFAEDYLDGIVSDVIPMLNFDGRFDMGAYAAAKALAHPPGSVFSYSSGTTNIVCRILRDIVGGPTQMLAFMTDELFEPIGMRTPLPKFDRSGTFVGSSYCLASPQDFARFGYLYLRDGVWNGRRILPEGWVDYARTPSHVSDTEAYGAHWWLTPHATRFHAGGYDGQRIQIIPEQDIVVVRCGRTPVAEVPFIWKQIDSLLELLA